MDHRLFKRRVDEAFSPGEDARWFLVTKEGFLLAQDEAGLHIPDTPTLRNAGLLPEQGTLLGDDTAPCVLAEVEPGELPPGFKVSDLRSTWGVLPDADYAIAGFASQIAQWDRTSRFCPVCGTQTDHDQRERAKRCPACGYLQYPRVHPCIIVLIYRDGQVLLTRQPSWPPNRYSLVAGFVESGESLEQCLRREITEEVGVAVDEIRYLGSQPWPFPHQLMCGFVAHYHEGDVEVDQTELEHAAWFDVDALPELSAPLSISRQIINWYLASLDDPSVRFPVEPYPGT